jgi:hypothetical protein
MGFWNVAPSLGHSRCRTAYKHVKVLVISATICDSLDFRGARLFVPARMFVRFSSPGRTKVSVQVRGKCSCFVTKPVLTFLCLGGTTLSYDVAYRTVRS